MAVMAIAFCLAYKPDFWVAKIKPLRYKFNGISQRSLFPLGLNFFRKDITKISTTEIFAYMAVLFTPRQSVNKRLSYEIKKGTVSL
jgi:hypothetical protein